MCWLTSAILKEIQVLAVSVSTLERPFWGTQVAFSLVWQQNNVCPCRFALSADDSHYGTGHHLPLFRQFTEITRGVHLAHHCVGAGDARAHEVSAHLEYQATVGRSSTDLMNKHPVLPFLLFVAVCVHTNSCVHVCACIGQSSVLCVFLSWCSPLYLFFLR